MSQMTSRGSKGTSADAALAPPRLPLRPPTRIDVMSLAENRDHMTSMAPDQAIASTLRTLMARWEDNPAAVHPMSNLRELLDRMRELPRGEARLRCMNTFVRILGQRGNLATVLDMMRSAAGRHGTRDRELVSVSLDSAKHSVYGWCGQTKILRSSPNPTAGTVLAEEGVQAILGKTPAGAWSLSMHIWQANPGAEGFAAGRKVKDGTIAEPPHSHPFDFVSMVSIGSMLQSTYADRRGSLDPTEPCATTRPGRYDDTPLEHVIGVWPSHGELDEVRLRTLEEHVLFREGDSYFLPCNAIHDVEIDSGASRSRPAVTLFLRSESVVRPHVYMAREMAAFHQVHPDLERSGRVLPEGDWHLKLERVADYLRGKSAALELADVVKYNAPYAFFHV